MAIRSGFFNSVNGDRRYLAYNFAEYFASFIGNGIFPNPSTGLQVYENTNMSITVKPGRGWINGYFVVNEGDFNLTLAMADGVLNRIDRIVLRMDNANREITIAVKKGALASMAVAPTLQRDADAYELAIADVYIKAGAVGITQANITDQRLNNAVCGIVHSVINQVDTTTLFNQYQTWFNELVANTGIEMDDWYSGNEEEFNTWFSSIKDILDGDIAGNLAALIVKQREDFTEHINDTTHVHWIGTVTGTNTLVGSYAPITRYKAGLGLSFSNATPNSGNVTLNINGLGPQKILKNGGEELFTDDLKTGVYTVRHDGTNFILQGEGGVNKTSQISNLRATVGFASAGQIKLDWNNPSDVKLKGVRILIKSGSYPTSPTDGIIFYDSNDSVPLNTFTISGWGDGNTYYIRAFAWTYMNATRIYTTDTNGAQVTAVPLQIKGNVGFSGSGTWTVPPGVNKVDVTLVGGGRGGGNSVNSSGGGGGGSGAVKVFKNIPTTPGTSCYVTVGSGGYGGAGGVFGIGSPGGESTFTSQGNSYTCGLIPAGETVALVGTQGGSGGGSGTGGYQAYPGAGGTDGGNSTGSTSYPNPIKGQGTTTRAFGEPTGTLFAGGGGGGSQWGGGGAGGLGGGGRGGGQFVGNAGEKGVDGTGGGGGGGGYDNQYITGANGGSGVVLIRWGY